MQCDLISDLRRRRASPPRRTGPSPTGSGSGPVSALIRDHSFLFGSHQRLLGAASTCGRRHWQWTLPAAAPRAAPLSSSALGDACTQVEIRAWRLPRLGWPCPATSMHHLCKPPSPPPSRPRLPTHQTTRSATTPSAATGAAPSWASKQLLPPSRLPECPGNVGAAAGLRAGSAGDPWAPLVGPCAHMTMWRAAPVTFTL
jgi:hypothetical protein